MSLDAIADGEGDRLSHCSADSSSEANGEEHALFSNGLIVGDKNGSQCSTGNGQEETHTVHTLSLAVIQTLLMNISCFSSYDVFKDSRTQI